MFISSSRTSLNEMQTRKLRGFGALSYGISFLDQALGGILKSDLILFGAPSGIGKTALCVQVALANLLNGKVVHYFALEAEKFEIEARIKFQLIADLFFYDPNRPNLSEPFTFSSWYLGKFLEPLAEYEELANRFFESQFSKLFLFYKLDKFDVSDFIIHAGNASRNTDLIILDHAHYFDFDDDNENRALKKIAVTARTIALENNKPIILVAHLRKRDRNNPELVAGLEEFHGSSDLYKIATRVVTFAPGPITDAGNYVTYFRIPKNRIDGGVTRYLARMSFNPRKGCYEEKYRLGRSDLRRGEDFGELETRDLPTWARTKPEFLGSDSHDVPRQPILIKFQTGEGYFETGTN